MSEVVDEGTLDCTMSFPDSIENRVITNKQPSMTYGKPCIICEQIITLNYPNEHVPDICPECCRRLSCLLYPPKEEVK